MPSVDLTLARFTPVDRDDWIATAAALLGDREQERFNAMSHPDDRALHAIGRALLRLIGSHATGRHPAAVEITISSAGKPALGAAPQIGVSVAHSGRVVAVAVGRDIDVGVDIEAAAPSSANSRRLAQRRFSATEAAALRKLPDDAAAEWFARAWTVKEAVGKALGVGIIPALAGAVVSNDADALVSVWSGPPADCWTIHQLQSPGGDEWITVATPAPRVELGTVSQLTLDAFAHASSAHLRPDLAGNRMSVSPRGPQRGV
jgi:4'-phosphopantetheinyl transferase